MVAELKYEISQNAYIKLVLHVLHHKTMAVNGVLLGRVNLQNESVVEIVDSVPPSHSNLALLPSLEIAFIMIEEHYGSKGMGIVGYFHANERFDDAELGIVSKNIGDHICCYFPQAVVFLLDNKMLEALPKGKDHSPMMQGSWKLDEYGFNQKQNAQSLASMTVMKQKEDDLARAMKRKMELEACSRKVQPSPFVL